jgi:hypothetical protein
MQTNKLFELVNTRATLDELNLDRRNARTYTLHDPIRWKAVIAAFKTHSGSSGGSTKHDYS